MPTTLFTGIEIIDVDYTCTFVPAFGPRTVLEKPYILLLLLVITGPQARQNARCIRHENRVFLQLSVLRMLTSS